MTIIIVYSCITAIIIIIIIVIIITMIAPHACMPAWLAHARAALWAALTRVAPPFPTCYSSQSSKWVRARRGSDVTGRNKKPNRTGRTEPAEPNRIEPNK